MSYEMIKLITVHQRRSWSKGKWLDEMKIKSDLKHMWLTYKN